MSIQVNQAQILNETKEFVRQHHDNDTTGHDWWHIQRVVNLAVHIGEREGANIFVCKLAALLHDVADEKLTESEVEGLIKIEEWLNSLHVEKTERDAVMHIIKNISFKGGSGIQMDTIEGQVVQDADRLDALGAIGIARTFTYSGAVGQPIYDPSIPVRHNMTKEEYRNQKSTTINHFYEKLFKLKDLMNTETGRKIAEHRHKLMESFVDEFLEEWDGRI